MQTHPELDGTKTPAPTDAPPMTATHAVDGALRRRLVAGVLVSAGAWLQACASAPAGQTTVPAIHREHVAHDVQQWHDAEHASCPYVAVTATRIERRDGDKALERWTVAACDGRTFDYAVSVSLLKGGIWDAVSDAGQPLPSEPAR